MSQRLTNILGYLTLIAFLAAIWVMFGEDPSREQGARGERTFPGLDSQINDAAVVRISHGDAVTFLNKVDGNWFVIQRDGYKADTDKVIEMLRGVALSERREPKTDNPDRFDKLGLGADALAVDIRDGEDKPLAAFDMGTRKDSPNGRSLTYIFQKSDTRSWLVTELAEASADPAWWLSHDLLNIKEARFHEIILRGVSLERGLGETDFTVSELGESETAQAGWQLRDPARVIAGLNLVDVRKLANPITDPVSTIMANTHDGLLLTIFLFDMDGASWAQITAAYDPQTADAGEAGTLPEAPADGAAEAAAINEQTRGWLFRLSDYDAGVLKRKRADFVEKKAAE